MNLLITTQKVDRNDDLLGFFHTWIERLAARFDKVTVVCLEKGEYDLPGNVEVLSLGKKGQVSSLPAELEGIRPARRIGGYQVLIKVKYVWRFYRYIWQYRREYDAVLVHMNAEYVVLGGLFWKLLGKTVYLWYNHQAGKWIARLAMRIADAIFYTSPFAFSARYSKAKQMPAGVDIEVFRPSGTTERQADSILFLGRISPVKNVETLIKAAEILDEKGVDFQLRIYGGTTDQAYFGKIKHMAGPLTRKQKLELAGPLPNSKTPPVYQSHSIFVNLTNSGSLDKATLEAMACGCLAVVSNRYFEDILPKDFVFKEKDAEDLARKLGQIIAMDSGRAQEVRRANAEFARSQHSLSGLVDELTESLRSRKRA
jgi:glycosyltransferase involved in cell wall biosynthesis